VENKIGWLPLRFEDTRDLALVAPTVDAAVRLAQQIADKTGRSVGILDEPWGDLIRVVNPATKATVAVIAAASS